MKILHVLGQRPGMTGSGFYLESIIGQCREHGCKTFKVAGVPPDERASAHGSRNPDAAYVYFESEALDFPVPGMSDVMPYNSSLFSQLKGSRLAAYKESFARTLRQAVRKFDPEVVHANHLFLLTALVRELFPRVPVVATCHGTELRQYHNCPHLRDYVKRNCRQLDRIIALTADQKAEIEQTYDIASDRITVIGGGYDETLFNRAPKPTTGPVHILFAGKFNRSKGLPWLLKTLFKMTGHDWHLHLAGSGHGPEFRECLDLAARLGSKVTNYGFVNHRRLAEIMKKVHIQVLPSFFEGLPLVLFEGLASGCRIITTDLAGFGEVLGKANRDTIDLIQLPPLETIDRPFKEDETRLEKKLHDSILRMMAAARQSPDYHDPRADEIASRYTWSRVFKSTLAVYQDAIVDRSPSNCRLPADCNKGIRRLIFKH